ncbi:MAG: hypothetical protein FRX49_12096 [Trebouxia sp. A1-2]|nr:MAG: hypothetical protein FRX49_12096 [Trebouxia sp. A1-2]
MAAPAAANSVMPDSTVLEGGPAASDRAIAAAALAWSSVMPDTVLDGAAAASDRAIAAAALAWSSVMPDTVMEGAAAASDRLWLPDHDSRRCSQQAMMKKMGKTTVGRKLAGKLLRSDPSPQKWSGRTAVQQSDRAAQLCMEASSPQEPMASLRLWQQVLRRNGLLLRTLAPHVTQKKSKGALAGLTVAAEAEHAKREGISNMLVTWGILIWRVAILDLSMNCIVTERRATCVSYSKAGAKVGTPQHTAGCVQNPFVMLILILMLVYQLNLQMLKKSTKGSLWTQREEAVRTDLLQARL